MFSYHLGARRFRWAGPPVCDARGMRLREWLEEVEGRATLDPHEPAAARDRLEAAAADLAGSLQEIGGVPWPLSVTNSVVADLHRCEGLAVARAGADEPKRHDGPDWRRLAGEALGAYVAHVLVEGPVAEAADDLASMWRAAGEWDRVDRLEAYLSAADPAAAPRRAELDTLARAALAFDVDRGWVPRVELPIGTTVGGALALRGRVDVVLGGPGTGRPAVLVEVKSGGPHPEHHAQLRHYVLLAALRHGEMPAAAGVWYPDDSLVDVHVPGAAESSAERVAAMARRLAAFWEGAPPTLRAGAHCRWCPVADTCAAAADPGDDGEPVRPPAGEGP